MNASSNTTNLTITLNYAGIVFKNLCPNNDNMAIHLASQNHMNPFELLFVACMVVAGAALVPLCQKMFILVFDVTGDGKVDASDVWHVCCCGRSSLDKKNATALTKVHVEGEQASTTKTDAPTNEIEEDNILRDWLHIIYALICVWTTTMYMLYVGPVGDPFCKAAQMVLIPLFKPTALSLWPAFMPLVQMVYWLSLAERSRATEEILEHSEHQIFDTTGKGKIVVDLENGANWQSKMKSSFLVRFWSKKNIFQAQKDDSVLIQKQMVRSRVGPKAYIGVVSPGTRPFEFNVLTLIYAWIVSIVLMIYVLASLMFLPLVCVFGIFLIPTMFLIAFVFMYVPMQFVSGKCCYYSICCQCVVLMKCCRLSKKEKRERQKKQHRKKERERQKEEQNLKRNKDKKRRNSGLFRKATYTDENARMLKIEEERKKDQADVGDEDEQENKDKENEEDQYEDESSDRIGLLALKAMATLFFALFAASVYFTPFYFGTGGTWNSMIYEIVALTSLDPVQFISNLSGMLTWPTMTMEFQIPAALSVGILFLQYSTEFVRWVFKTFLNGVEITEKHFLIPLLPVKWAFMFGSFAQDGFMLVWDSGFWIQMIPAISCCTTVYKTCCIQCACCQKLFCKLSETDEKSKYSVVEADGKINNDFRNLLAPGNANSQLTVFCSNKLHLKQQQLSATHLKLWIDPNENQQIINARLSGFTHLKTLPSFGQLKALQVLNLRGCDNLTSLPILPATVTELNLTKNYALALPDLAYLQRLNILRVFFQGTATPLWMFQLKELEILELSEAWGLEIVDKKIVQLQNLRVLIL